MTPYQCPECGRFLKNGLVASLGGTTQVACPGCDTALTADMFTDTPASDGNPAAASADAAGDVLDGWDTDGAYDPDRDDLPPFPQDAIIVGGAAVAGALLGALVADRKGAGAILGALAGAAGAGAARQIWRLAPDEAPADRA